MFCCYGSLKPTPESIFKKLKVYTKKSYNINDLQVTNLCLEYLHILRKLKTIKSSLSGYKKFKILVQNIENKNYYRKFLNQKTNYQETEDGKKEFNDIINDINEMCE
jgi:hypothetical protein